MLAQLASQTPSPLALRDQLEEMVLKELLGPAEGETEECIESPSTRYLVGLLAPRRKSKRGRTGARPSSAVMDEKAQAADSDDEGDDGELLDNEDLALGGSDSVHDGTTDQVAAQEKVLIPSSFGFSICVDAEAKELQVMASWGQYLRAPSEFAFNEKTGNPKLIWKRQPRGGNPHRVKLVEGPIPPIIADKDCPEILIQGLIRRRNNHWSVTLFLVNEQQEPERNRDLAWIFQCKLVAEATDGSALFHKRQIPIELSGTDEAIKAENQMLGMLYRNRVEFAVGHGVSVHVKVASENPNRATRVETQVVPGYEVARSTPPKAEDASVNPAFGKLSGLVLDMKELAETEPKDYRSKIQPLLDAYKEWIDREEKKISDPSEGLESFRDAAERAIRHCHETLRRIEDGIALIESDPIAAEAFQFMNRAMWLQRTRSLFAEKVRRDEKVPLAQLDIPANRSWYPFQLAFIVLNLPGITRLDHPERSEEPSAIADLLWFPTGGGKTEAYLGLTAYTLALRRLQGTIEGRTGESGVAVLMRYTLRLLTLQQFQRASALMCACESIRREALDQGNTKWGKTPFRIGLWVGGSTTPNRTDDSDEAVKSHHDGRRGGVGGIGSPHQLTNCPWCGAKIEPGKHIRVERFNEGACRTIIYCGSSMGECIFSRKHSPTEGLPVMVVDEEIYRRLPSVLITTVDKFAQMPWNGTVQMLFGKVNGYCERHGFRSPDIDDTDSHPKTRGGVPAAKTMPHNPLRPPDLIIQDELHLISGPLGTLVGLYETAIDQLCCWEVGGKPVRPKVIASTATIRQARDQVFNLFARTLNIFPPSGLEIGDNFFSLQRKPSEAHPGRKYIGICAPGRRLKAALIRVYVAFLAASQKLFEDHGVHSDPWMTLVGYFNSLRELGGMRRLVDDDVRTRLGRMDTRGLAKRILYTPDSVRELTSRLGSTAIPETLDLLEAIFDPVQLKARKDKKETAQAKPRPLDVLLATNMISVGVDVSRLGLMVVGGQPKTTAEYIQATSRVGRKHPGLVCTVYNWARPRDLSHYETFEHYHATFYKHVEALSVTPFSAGAIQRGLSALLVSLIRLTGIEFNENDKAMMMATERSHDYVKKAIEVIGRRAELENGPETGHLVRKILKKKMDVWQRRAQRQEGTILVYKALPRSGNAVGLLSMPGIEKWDEFTCLNSLRDVEPMANLVLDDYKLDNEEESDEIFSEADES